MSLSAILERATLDQLIRHARSFGTECVYETGEQEGLSSADLARPRIELDELEAGRKSRHGFSIGKRRRRSSDETRAAALALSVDGFVPKAIADKLGISDRTVRGYLKQSGATAYAGISELERAA
ncbi:MAG TPA: helix-turn-helix domain-containing protein [Dehalococcoidia bacterium]|nr:helix-turn-helix domain-containing protein [Dehalococcoidia bacterium]